MCASKLYFGCRSFDSVLIIRPADEVSQSLKDWKSDGDFTSGSVLSVRKFETANSQSGDSTGPTHVSSSSNGGDFFGSLARYITNFHSIPYTSKQTFLYILGIRLINDYSTVGMKNIARDVT